MLHYYKALLGKQQTIRELIEPKIISQGPTLSIAQPLELKAPFSA